MKIAHLISSQIFAGIEQHVYELSAFMSDVSEQVIICDESIRHHMRGNRNQVIEYWFKIFSLQHLQTY